MLGNILIISKEYENKVRRIDLIVDEAPSDVVYDEESIDTYAMISVLWKAEEKAV